MPQIPLSVGSKLELLCLCQISVYFPVHSRICPRMHMAMYIRVYTMYMTEAPRVLHFSAFIIHVVRRREHLAAETTEERETGLSRRNNNNVLSISWYIHVHMYRG